MRARRGRDRREDARVSARPPSRSFAPARFAAPAPTWPARLVRCLVVAGVIVAVALTLAFRYGTERMWWVEIARYVPYPAYLGPALLLIGLAWRLGWAWRIAALVAAGLVVTEVMGLVVGRADEGSDRVRLMTYNAKAYLAARRPDGFARLAWEIANADADVIVMQDAGAVASHRAQAGPVFAALAGRQTYVEDQYIVASRFPLTGCAPGRMAASENPDAVYVRCTVTVNGRDVDLFTAHFVSPREGLNAARGRAGGGLAEWEGNFADRLTQAGQLMTGLVKTARPLIVAGDLNAEENSPVIRRLLSLGLRDAFGSAGFGYGYTYGHDLRPGFSFLRIDHVLVSEAIGVQDCRVGGGDGSEHRPVIADLLIRRR
jgi:endonuclease/exonuclease/phosphatase (EEP) superfamily protein YafD